MGKHILSIAAVLLACVISVAKADPPPTTQPGDPQISRKMADELMQACGATGWSKVASIQFTFNVEKDGKLAFSATHDWNVRKQTDTIIWNGKTVTVDLNGDHSQGDAKEAFARWTNDSYWLLCPFKIEDPGVHCQYCGIQDGFDVLHLSFDQVGLTPGDQYNLYLDPKTHLISKWDYMPKPDAKTTGVWEGYQQFGPLMLSLDRHFGEKHIYFSDVKVVTD